MSGAWQINILSLLSFSFCSIRQWNLDLTKWPGTGKLVTVRYIKGLLNRKARYNEFAEKQPKCSLYRGIHVVNKYGLLTKCEVKITPSCLLG